MCKFVILRTSSSKYLKFAYIIVVLFFLIFYMLNNIKVIKLQLIIMRKTVFSLPMNVKKSNSSHATVLKMKRIFGAEIMQGVTV